MNHAELVIRARRWLLNTQRCALVSAEARCMAISEQPDAVGWHANGHCLVVECKASWEDFMRDQHKCHHRGGRAIGTRRWYLTPPALVLPEAVPADHGLLWAYPQVVRVQKKAPARTHDAKVQRLEQAMLLALGRQRVLRLEGRLDSLRAQLVRLREGERQ